MTKHGFLTNPKVVAWLDGIEPAWTLLDFDSISAISDHDPVKRGAIAFDLTLPAEVFSGSAVLRNAGLLLTHAAAEEGLTLTATGNLTRRLVAALTGAMTWPGYDVQEVLRFCKVVNERDVMPLHFLRLLLQEARLLRKSKDRLVLTKRGRMLAQADNAAALQAELLSATFNRLNLGYFDRVPLEGWPQSHWGLAVWCLAVGAHDWSAPARLMRLATIPVNAVLEATWDFPSAALEARILRPLCWFGLLEMREPERRADDRWQPPDYRASDILLRFVRFNVAVEPQTSVRH